MTGPVISAGSLLIKDLLPAQFKEHYDPTKVMNKKEISNLVSKIITHSKDDSDHEVVNKLGKLFFQKATDIGASIPLSDFHNDSDERATLMGEFSHRVGVINNNTKLSDRERDAKLGELTADYSPRVEKQNQSYLLSKGSTAAKMTLTGARGNASQLMQASSGALITIDAQGKPIPVAVVHSFAEGMSPQEHLAMSYTARGNTVLSQLSTALPGALFKKLTPNVFHEVITVEDCGTHNGVPIPGSDKLALIGRYTADTNKLINEELYRDLKDKKFVKVRSVLTCEAKDGLCVHCYGLLATGKKPEIGFNVGTIAAQSVSEVLTQSMLSTKHSSRTAGGKSRNTYEVVNNLLSNPESFQDEATISGLNGKVDRVHKTALNDHEVYINGVKHFVPNEQEVTVKHGDSVSVGQPLSTGTVNPRELVGLTGIGNGRVHFSNQLRESYGSGLDPRHFDLIAKNLMKYVTVDHPGTTDFSHGEVVDVNRLEKQLREDESSHKLHEAEGKTLSRKILNLTPGTKLTTNHVDHLANHGIDKIHATKSGIRITPIVPGLQTAKLLDPNWISKLSFNHIRDTIQSAAVFGHKSDIHSTDPITPYVMGKDFGDGEDGKY